MMARSLAPPSTTDAPLIAVENLQLREEAGRR